MSDDLQKQSDAVSIPTQKEFERELPQDPGKGDTGKGLLSGVIALLVGVVAGLFLWVKGFFSDKVKLLLLMLMAVSANAATFYVATTGSSGNNGLTPATPWDVATATAVNATASNDVVLFLDGIYNNVTFTIHQTNNTTFRSLNKWGAVFTNSAGNGISIFNSGATTSHDITIDGFKISNAAGHGIFIQCDSNCIVRNCWLNVVGTAGIHSGISAVDGTVGQEGEFNMIFERNLIELVGNTANAKFDHCMYVAGTNITIRDNVCRYATGNGIQINDNTNLLGSTNILIQNNLSYNNARAQLILSSSFGRVGATVIGNTFFNQTNYVIANSNTNAAIGINVINGTCTLNASNNILIGGGGTLYENSGTKVVNNDYNIFMRSDNLPVAAHNIQVANGNGIFVNTNSGLFWLATGSSAIGAAISTQFSSNNFWGVPQTSVSDIGAFQYNATFATDARTLDPSGTNPNYWAFLTPQTYYVDYATGLDWNDGLSKSSPWQNHPYMTNARSGLPYSHLAGDHFIFKIGVTWPSNCFAGTGMNIAAGGTSGAYDYYGVDPTWTVGGTRPIFDGQNKSGFILHFPDNSKYVTFDSIEMCHITRSGRNGFGSLIYAGFCQYMIFTNDYLHGWLPFEGDGLNQDDFGGGYVGNYSAGTGPDGMYLTGCEIENSENGASGKWNGTAVNQAGIMTNCYVHDNGSLCLNCIEAHNCHFKDQGTPYANIDANYHLNMFYMLNPAGQSYGVASNGFFIGNLCENVAGESSGEVYASVAGIDCYVLSNTFTGTFPTFPIFADTVVESLTTTPAHSLYVAYNTSQNPNFNSSLVHITQRFLNNDGVTPIQFANLNINTNTYCGPGTQTLTDANIATWAVAYQELGNNFLGLCAGQSQPAPISIGPGGQILVTGTGQITIK